MQLSGRKVQAEQMRLGEVLLKEGLVTADALEEALESQVVHGGRLGTNLVELGLLSEADLARSLGRLHNVSHASGEMTPDPRALELVDYRFADEKDILPMRVETTRLIVAVINPGDIETFDTVAFKTGKRVIPVIIPEFRMNQLLRRYCKGFRPIRAIDVNTVRPSRTMAGRKSRSSSAAPTELMNEEEFQLLYAKALRGGATSEEEILEAGEVVEDETAAPPSSEVTADGAGPVSPSAPTIRVFNPPIPMLPTLEANLSPEPLSFAEAQNQLSASGNRDEIGRNVLRFAISKWKRALLLSVQGDLVSGWQGMGQGIQDHAVGRIALSLQSPSTFKLVRDTRSHYVGKISRDSGTNVFYKVLGGGYPANAILLPLLVRGKVVHILYVDNGPKQITTPDIGELMILSQSVARCYETLLRRRKAN